MFDLSWQAKANCRGEDTSLFFPEDGGLPDEVERLRKLCATCPVRVACRKHSLQYEDHGFWAGMGRSEREAARRELGIKKRAYGSLLKRGDSHEGSGGT